MVMKTSRAWSKPELIVIVRGMADGNASDDATHIPT